MGCSVMADQAPTSNPLPALGCLLVIGLLVWAGRSAFDWWGTRTKDGCFYATVTPYSSDMCVWSHNLGAAITLEQLASAHSATPPLFCGTPLQAADFTQKAGAKICAQTMVQDARARKR